MKKALPMILTVLILAGCWDQENLGDKRLINGISFDVSEENPELIKGGVRALDIKSQGGGEIKVNDELLIAKGSTTAELGHNIKHKLPGKLDITKAFLIFIGDELVKEGLYPLLEIFYRGNLGYLPAKIVIVKGKALDILRIKDNESPIAFRVLSGIEAAETNTLIPRGNLFTLWNKMEGDRIDPILPLVTKDKGKSNVTGVALFNQDKYTGKYLPDEEATILLYFMDRKGHTGDVHVPYKENPKKKFELKVMKINRNMDVQVSGDNSIICTLDLELVTELNADPLSIGNVKKMEKQTSEYITKRGGEIMEKLQKANSDPLGIGMEVSSKYPELWKQIDWKSEYKNVKIVPKVSVRIEKTGGLF
ncbi:Ger(x)C family spore germination protein [Halobacillus shinanisalinarum]|uniref:Ger(X)C family spore germination protein n=1 Tax=Halobacillus shinanisalinarum TaxID=2932258 RepID=A0ABY4H122_9BACI|nr:Ger(x)C family spore germination protein [Halobacillus shinanisalinarum]UOQ93873.1 Ger(x)C family spore germination protein [Halobacillus shinanisalinarum]